MKHDWQHLGCSQSCEQ